VADNPLLSTLTPHSARRGFCPEPGARIAIMLPGEQVAFGLPGSPLVRNLSFFWSLLC
jgi:hypothetical protein